MAKFATGDVVILVSGSMKMAVETTDAGVVKVIWADGGVVQRAEILEALLDKYIAPERSSYNRPDGPRGGGGDRGGFKPKRDFGDRPGGGGGGGGFKPGGGGGGFRPGGGAGGPRKDFGDKPRGAPRRDRD